MSLDRFDRAILQALQLDGRLANSALAERLYGDRKSVV